MRVFQLIFRSRLSTLAALSIVVLLFALVWQVRHLFLALTTPTSYVAVQAPSAEAVADAELQQEMLLLGLATTTDPSATSDTDPIAMIGPVVVAQLAGQYAGLLDAGTYSPEKAEAAAGDIARNVRAAVPYKTYVAGDFKTDTDISYDRMLVYRSDLREALSPLLKNTESELEIFAKYIETSDPAHLEKLSIAAANYRAAASTAAALTIPRDAINYHRDILNAMEQFSATLDALVKNADDAFASVALLRTYNSAEERMFFSFDALGDYYGQKLP